MAIDRIVTIVTRDTDQKLKETNITEVNPTIPGASLQAAVQAFMATTTNTYVTAYVTDKQFITDIA